MNSIKEYYKDETIANIAWNKIKNDILDLYENKINSVDYDDFDWVLSDDAEVLSFTLRAEGLDTDAEFIITGVVDIIFNGDLSVRDFKLSKHFIRELV